jgi:predicted AlkP superfamily pyrophosphatase or phosphodiesterase
LSRFIKAKLNFRGYFDLYNIPFRHISLYDFTEKRSPLQPGGMNRGKNIFDHLREEEISYHVSDPARTEEQNLHKLLDDITQERIEFAFLYWPGLDGLMHMEGNDSPQVGVKLRQYEAWIQHLVETTARHYSEAPLYVFSDHGMANCDKVIDLRSQIEALPLQLGPDYAAVYDSTMARFWFFSPTARQMVEQLLAGVSEGRILPDSELEGLGTLFPDRYFGELIFLVREGVLIVPSDMGERPIRAMHGYHPSEPQSYAVLCANQPELPVTVDAIPDMFQIMLTEARAAKEKNERRGRPAPQRETAG